MFRLRKGPTEYRHRWEIYNDLLCGHLSKESVWFDVGCGCNEYVADFGNRAKSALGIDVQAQPGQSDAPFLQADLRKIPLPDASANLITLRMVVEHLEEVPRDFSEINRLLAPGGALIVLTTNTLSPLVLLPRIIPYPLKRWLIAKMFHVDDSDIFPTFHRFNTPKKLKNGVFDLKLSSLEYLEEIPAGNRLLTLVFGLWYSITAFAHLRFLRSSMLAVYLKNPAPEKSGF
jgi:SAM-dependent methyltransferase